MASEPSPEPASEPPAPRRSLRYWVTGLVGGLVLAVLIIAGLNLYREQFRLTQEKLDAARTRWEAAGIRSYDAQVSVSGSTQGVYEVQVRNGRIVGASFNGQPFEVLDRAYPWTVAGLFSVVLQQDLDHDRQPGCPIPFTQIEFDAADGHLVRYVRSTSNQRVIIDVRLTVLPNVAD